VDEWKIYFKKSTPSLTINCRWTTPVIDTVKINIDASFHDHSWSGGWGAICRDNSSDICFAAAGTLSMIRDAFQAEATALSNAMHVADKLRVGRVVFETDYQLEVCHADE
jgi:ribonuclease HI